MTVKYFQWLAFQNRIGSISVAKTKEAKASTVTIVAKAGFFGALFSRVFSACFFPRAFFARFFRWLNSHVFWQRIFPV
jgi:H+/Cl- antiporter ClcA